MLKRNLGWILSAALTVACGPGAPAAQPSPAGADLSAAADPVPGGGSGARAERAAAPAPDADGRPRVVFLGTSLTAGLGVPSDLAYPALIQERIDRAGLEYRVINAGVSGDTSAGGLRRIDWLLREPIDVLVLELGANDMLRGQDLDALRSNLQQIIDRARAASAQTQIVIAGMQAAPNLGERYGEQFAQTFADLAHRNGAEFIPFLLEGVAAVPELNQPDGMHPTPQGHAVIADTVWSLLGPLLRKRAEHS